MPEWITWQKEKAEILRKYPPIPPRYDPPAPYAPDVLSGQRDSRQWKKSQQDRSGLGSPSTAKSTPWTKQDFDNALCLCLALLAASTAGYFGYTLAGIEPSNIYWAIGLFCVAGWSTDKLLKGPMHFADHVSRSSDVAGLRRWRRA